MVSEYFPATMSANGRLVGHAYRAGARASETLPARFWTLCGVYLPDDTDLWVNEWSPCAEWCETCAQALADAGGAP